MGFEDGWMGWQVLVLFFSNGEPLLSNVWGGGKRGSSDYTNRRGTNPLNFLYSIV